MKNFIRSIGRAIHAGQMRKAQYEIARQLWASEYRHEPFDYIHTMVTSGRVAELVTVRLPK